MKTPIRRLLAAGLALSLVLGSAWAAPEGDPETDAAQAETQSLYPEPEAPDTYESLGRPIAVQLDGENVAFTDAYPQVREERTFLPFRAVFEAMGATVSYAGDMISAFRQGRHIYMTLGSPEVHILEGARDTTFLMDVAPYVDENTWRTYVPVRFAAQALGALVGWDQESFTVVIVDAERLLEDALARQDYTDLARLLSFSERYNEGAWALDLTGTGTVTVPMAGGQSMEVPVNASVKGTTADGSKLDLNGTVTSPTSLWRDTLAREGTAITGSLAPLQNALLRSIADRAAQPVLRGDLWDRMLYLGLNGLTSDPWYSASLYTLAAQPGMEMVQFLNGAETGGYVALMLQVLQNVDVDSAALGYAKVASIIANMTDALSNDGFVRKGNEMVTTLSAQTDRFSVSLGLSLHLDEHNTVNGYAMTMNSISYDPVAGWGSTGLDTTLMADGTLTGSVKLLIPGGISLEGTYAGTYVSTRESSPTAAPPEGATVVDLFEAANG